MIQDYWICLKLLKVVKWTSRINNVSLIQCLVDRTSVEITTMNVRGQWLSQKSEIWSWSVMPYILKRSSSIKRGKATAKMTTVMKIQNMFKDESEADGSWITVCWTVKDVDDSMLGDFWQYYRQCHMT